LKFDKNIEQIPKKIN